MMGIGIVRYDVGYLVFIDFFSSGSVTVRSVSDEELPDDDDAIMPDVFDVFDSFTFILVTRLWESESDDSLSEEEIFSVVLSFTFSSDYSPSSHSNFLLGFDIDAYTQAFFIFLVLLSWSFSFTVFFFFVPFKSRPLNETDLVSTRY